MAADYKVGSHRRQEHHPEMLGFIWGWLWHRASGGGNGQRTNSASALEKHQHVPVTGGHGERCKMMGAAAEVEQQVGTQNEEEALRKSDGQRLKDPLLGLDYRVTVDSVITATTPDATHLPPGKRFAQQPKRVRFIRHGNGTHNATLDFNNPAQTDARLTAKGLAQCAKLQIGLENEGEICKPDLLITSTLTRALQTACNIYAARLDEYTSGSNGSDRKRPPLRKVSTELCREEISTHFCDTRRPLSELRNEFEPFGFDFSSVDYEQDVLWAQNKAGTQSEHRKTRVFGTYHGGFKVWRTWIESQILLEDRVRRFVEFLLLQPENEVVVISHAVFLHALGRVLATQKVNNLTYAEARLLTAAWKNSESRVFLFYPLVDDDETR
ncbi:Phosphoglycerate mutase-like protein [Porphyridium purpureum]|uniref:Phosphoglycerate mutase-like protein n=1 Tax=Porphyridium purpureum TaxID=35688 RepID=A0A5J4YZJ9_PORPP|nr:Phosphoglycerate mutase-like protein [Porphyridium purpureum]|eukprot:POR4670..scf209_3